MVNILDNKAGSGSFPIYYYEMQQENIDKLGSAISEEDEDTKKERVIVKGFSAYKENSQPIEKKEKSIFIL